MNIVVKLAELAKELDSYLTYEYRCRVDAPGELLCSRNETYRIYSEGYKTIYLPTFEQVMELKSTDFIPE
jgi:hypothetical protein